MYLLIELIAVHKKNILAFCCFLFPVAAFSDASSAINKDTIYYSEVAPLSLPENGVGIKRKVDLRPKDSYKLLGGGGRKICEEVLSVFNEEGSYSGLDSMYWRLENSGLIKWGAVGLESVLLAGEPQPSFGVGVEFVDIDLDGDGKVEYIYRAGNITNSQQYQVLGIFDEKLQDAPDELIRYKNICIKYDGSSTCDSAATQIRYLLEFSVVHHPNEWGENVRNMLEFATSDMASKK